MARALKVFRTPIGFHDAYVAAPSRKAALEAWGAAKDLFGSGSAEQVTDPELTKAPLASPGKIIKISRGNIADHLRAAGKGMTKKPGSTARPSAPQAAPAPKPRPSRKALDLAEAAITQFEEQAAAERSILDEREAKLRWERKALNARHQRDADKLDARLGQARETYDRAMDRWRGRAEDAG